jgi:hypothetical protein
VLGGVVERLFGYDIAELAAASKRMGRAVAKGAAGCVSALDARRVMWFQRKSATPQKIGKTPGLDLSSINHPVRLFALPPPHAM